MIKTQINLNKSQNQKSKEAELGLLTLMARRKVEEVVDEGGGWERVVAGLVGGGLMAGGAITMVD